MSNSEIKGGRVAAIITACAGAACILSTIIALSVMGTVYGFAPGFADVLSYIYNIGAVFSVFALLFVWSLLSGRRHVGLAKTACWGMFILALMIVTPFFTDRIGYLAAMDFVAGLRYFSAYVAYAALDAVLIVAFMTWDRPRHRALRTTSFICSLVSVFCAVLYLWEIFPSVASATTLFDKAQFLGIFFGYLTVVLVNICFWIISASDIVFVRVFLKIDEAEARVYIKTRETQEIAFPAEASRAYRMLEGKDPEDDFKWVTLGDTASVTIPEPSEGDIRPDGKEEALGDTTYETLDAHVERDVVHAIDAVMSEAEKTENGEDD